jgi:hypothetical protein
MNRNNPQARATASRPESSAFSTNGWRSVGSPLSVVAMSPARYVATFAHLIPGHYQACMVGKIRAAWK